MAYDAQVAGWYLLHPEIDGTLPGGDAGSVTNVDSKQGYGISKDLSNITKVFSSSKEPQSASNEGSKTDSSRKVENTNEVSNPITSAYSPPSSTKGVTRAAMMKEQMGIADDSNEKLKYANTLLEHENKVILSLYKA
jgi:hypothetical protein